MFQSSLARPCQCSAFVSLVVFASFLLVSCGPSVSSKAPIRVESLKHENLTGKLWKEVDDGWPRWYVDFAWSHASFRFKSAGYWCAEFFERQLNTSQETSFTHLGNTCTEHGPRDAIVPDIWWGTTREFRVRMKVTEPGDNEREQKETVSAFSAPMTFTFPPMPVELVLAKMGAPVHATTCTSIVRRMIQAACVRQLYRWRGGLCIKETALEEIVAAITQHPQVPPAEVLSKMDVQSHTTTCSYVEHQWPQSLCAEISGEWTPPREGYKSMCVKDTALADIVEAFAEDPQ